uniref:Uncharacterized protein n=1 Tax=Ovis aries TaxID=9940 RepID=A0AC11EFD3_SHEEP
KVLILKTNNLNCHTQNIWSTKTFSFPSEGRIIRKALDTHRLARNHINDGSVTRFQEFRAIFQLFPRTTINLLLQLSKLASNVSCVTIQHRCISSTDLAWMVQNNHLERRRAFSCVSKTLKVIAINKNLS